jgi:PAS domain S-box-containing protein
MFEPQEPDSANSIGSRMPETTSRIQDQGMLQAELPLSPATRFAWLPVTVLLTLIVLLYGLPGEIVIWGLHRLPALNLVFSGLVPLLAAMLAAGSYFSGGLPAPLLLGSGMLAFGMANLLAGIGIPGGQYNAGGAVYNMGVCLAGLYSLAAALRLLPPLRRPLPWPPWIVLLVDYGGVLLLMTLIRLAAYARLLPAVFLAARGPAPLGQLVLAAAVAGFTASAALLLYASGRRSGLACLRWYGLGLVLIAVGLAGVSGSRNPGGLLGWAGRGAQYLGGVYLLVALAFAVRRSGSRAFPLEALRETQQRYTSLVDSCPDAILVHVQGRYVFANPAAARLLGAQSSRQLVGRPVLELVHPDFRRIVQDRIRGVLAQRQPAPQIELKSLRLDGQPVDVESVIVRVEYEGQPAVQVVLHDISERKRAEAALRESEERLKLALRSARMVSWSWDAATDRVTVSDNYPEIFGQPPIQTAQERLALIHPEDLARHRATVDQAVREGGPYHCEFRIIRPDTKEEVWLEEHASVQKNAAGQPVYMGGVVRDITVRRRAERALLESREDLNRAQAVASIGSWRLDARHNRLLWSDETYRIFEVPPGTAVTYESFLAFVHPQDRAGVDREWAAARRGEPYDIEHRIVAGGQVKWVRERVELEFDSDGALRGGFGTVQDISERKQAENALRESERRLSMAQEVAHMGSWEMDLATGESVWSDEFFRICGLQPQAFRPNVERGLQLIHPEDRPAAAEAIRRTVEQGTPYAVENRICRPDGSVRHVFAQGETIRDESGKPVRLIGSFLDITNRKRGEERLKRAVQEARSMTRFPSENPNPVLRVLSDGRLAYANPASRALLAAWNAQVGEVVPGDLLQTIQSALAMGSTQEVEMPGEDRVYLFTLAPIADGGYVNLYGRDITRMKQAEQALREANENLERRVAERTVMAEERARRLQALALQLTEAEEQERRRIAELLHEDLQQLLAAARFQLLMLQPAVQGHESLRSTLQQVDALLEQSIGKSRGLSHDLSPAVLHYSGLPAAVEWLSRQMKERHGLSVDVKVERWVRLKNELLQVFLFRVIQELLFNVIKHAGVDAAKVRLRRLGERVEVVVSDDGKGFDLASLKAPGYPVKGFGLFGIQERLSYIGGEMRVETAPGEGSLFCLSIPLKGLDRPRKLPPGRSSKPGPAPAGRINAQQDTRYRVLLVDDHRVMRQGLIALLDSQPDIRVVGEAADGREAVELARRLNPGVIVMDVAMPVMDGIEATRLIKGEMPQVRVIGLSMLGEEEMAERMKRAGAEAWLSKVGPSEALIEAIRGE